MKAIFLYSLCHGRNVTDGFVIKKILMSVVACTITIHTTVETFWMTILVLNKQKIWKHYVLTKNKLDGTGTRRETSATFLPVGCSMWGVQNNCSIQPDKVVFHERICFF